MKNILHISINDPRPSWEYKTRSRYIVRPELVEELDIHQVTRSVPGFQTLELPREHVSLAHFRWFITARLHSLPTHLFMPQELGERESFPWFR